MTREEAHTLLEVMAIELTGELANSERPVTEQTKLLGKQLKAIDMAIEALSAEAEGDLISRQDAVNTIKRYKHRLEGKGQTYGFLLEEFEHQIPSAQTDGDFISRADAIEELCTMMVDCFDADEEVIDAIRTTMNEIPSAEAVQRGW